MKSHRRVQIKDIAYYLPHKVVTNEDLHRENPQWDIQRVAAKTGVMERHIAEVGETALDLSVKACEKLLKAHPDLREKIDAIVFCTQSEDYIMPPNSSILHHKLKLSDDVFAMDFNLACSGYVYGIAVAQGLIQAGTAKNILLVTADTYSKYIHERDRSARVLFGDGAAVSWITESSGKAGIDDLICATSGKDYDKFIIPAGGTRCPRSPETSIEKADSSGNVRTQENIHMNGLGVLTFVKVKVPPQIEKILHRNHLKMEDVDKVILHQASLMAMEWLEKKFDLTDGKSFSNLAKVGNTVSASIPIALKDAMEAGQVKHGDRVLLVGFGVGLSYASALVTM